MHKNGLDTVYCFMYRIIGNKYKNVGRFFFAIFDLFAVFYLCFTKHFSIEYLRMVQHIPKMIAKEFNEKEISLFIQIVYLSKLKYENMWNTRTAFKHMKQWLWFAIDQNKTTIFRSTMLLRAALNHYDILHFITDCEL